MAKITKEMIEKAYEIFHTLQKGVTPLVQMGMNENSAEMTMIWYEHILNGKLYKRTGSAMQVEFILEKLFHDQDKDRLALVLQSLNQYIEFYSERKFKKVRITIEKFEEKLARMT